MKTKRSIPDIIDQSESLRYFSGHYFASLGEIEKYGVDKFDKLANEINREIPDGELAGSHRHGIVVSSRIPKKPKWMRKEIELHEILESRYMK